MNVRGIFASPSWIITKHPRLRPVWMKNCRQPTIAVLTVAVLFGLLLFGAGADRSAKPRDVWVRIVFGTDGKAAEWDGKLSVQNGHAIAIAEGELESVDRLIRDSFSWTINTGPMLPTTGRRRSFAEPQRSILVKLWHSPATRMIVKTRQGAFAVSVAELRAGRPTTLLRGRASIELLGSEAAINDTRTQDDFPSIAVDEDGSRHVAWIAYGGGESSRLLVRDVDDRSSKLEAIADAGEFSSLRLLNTADGLRSVWSSPAGRGDWDIYTSTRGADGWTVPKRLTTAAGTDFQLDAASNGATVWIVWQSFRNGNGDIFAKCFRNGTWSDEVAVASGDANEWEPMVAVDRRGVAWIVYDTYEHGNYDVYLNSVALRAGKPVVGERIAIARSERFEAHASVLVDREGRVWVAYDQAGPHWGKDNRRRNGSAAGFKGEPLHLSRKLGLRCVVDGHLHEPSVVLPQQSLLPSGTRFYEYPQLVSDQAGRMWLFFRMCRQGKYGVGDKGNRWEIFATTYTRNGWLKPIQLPISSGRQNQRVSVAAGDDGRLHTAWSEGNHSIVREDRKCSVHYGTLPEVDEPSGALPLQPITVEPPGTPERVSPPPWTVKRGGHEYRLYFGDLHRHTNISICLPRVDGSQNDAHRYAMDAARLDFLAVTDHTHDLDAYAWWRIQQAADQFHIPGRYVPIYAYERSNFAEGGGHRNVFFLKRGWEINGSDYYYRYHSYLGLKKPNTDPEASLYPWLKEGGDAFTIAHTPEFSKARQRGTWNFHDEQVEPVAEIFQGFRQSYERPSEQVREQASLWHALAKGYRLGFIASSDHRSTHQSYACVWAKESSRRSLFDAILSRRTYAATDRIALDFRIGDAVMGEQTAPHSGDVVLKIRAAGTAPISEVQIIRSGRVLATLNPLKQNIEMEYRDRAPESKPGYYYVRLKQTDGNLAWGSPIWIESRLSGTH